MENKKMVIINYTNYRGETRLRKIIPQKIWYGSTKWHNAEQWLLDAYDVEKNTNRTFAIKDVQSWSPEE